MRISTVLKSWAVEVTLALSFFALGCGGAYKPTPTLNIPQEKIVFTSEQQVLTENNLFLTNVWIMNPDGTLAMPLLSPTPWYAFIASPVWSPDGTRIAFISNQALDAADSVSVTAFNVWVANADGTGAMPLTKLMATYLTEEVQTSNPVWSPDGKQIAFTSNRALDGSQSANLSSVCCWTTSNIWLVDSDGMNLRPLTHMTSASADCVSPVWSPDGTEIAFTSMRALDGSDATTTNRVNNIWVMNADGSGARFLAWGTSLGTSSEIPAWSPDGTKIAFDSQQALAGSYAPGSVFNIWVMNADGTGSAPLTRSMFAQSSGPVWSPDATRIAFSSAQAVGGNGIANSAYNIWVMNADGTQAMPLTKMTVAGADSRDPVWSPDGAKIAFDSLRALDGSDTANRSFNVWVMGADGTGATALTRSSDSGNYNRGPQWRP